MSDFTITARRGDTIRLLVSVIRAGSPVDLSGALLWFTAKTSAFDADDASGTIQKSSSAGVVVTDASGGLAIVTIDPEDTDALTRETRYVCDVQMKESDGTITTVAVGTLIVKADITRASI